MPGGLRQRPLLSPAGHAAVDQPRIVAEQHVRSEPEPLHHAGAEALDQPVGVAGKLAHLLDALSDLRSSVNVSARERRVHVEARRDDRRLTRALDPDHVGAMIGKHHAANGAGPRPASSTMRMPSSAPAIACIERLMPRDNRSCAPPCSQRTEGAAGIESKAGDEDESP